MSCFTRSSALIAANRASGATTELLRYACEGDGMPHMPFGTQDPTVELARALIVSAEVEREGMKSQPGQWDRETEALIDLANACRQFISDWSGADG